MTLKREYPIFRITIVLMLLLIATPEVIAQQLSLIPIPAHFEKKSGQFTINAQTRIKISVDTPQMRNAVSPLTERLSRTAGFQLPVSTLASGSNLIECTLVARLTGDESYRLRISPTRIHIEAKTEAGIFYAIQTIRQLLPAKIESTTFIGDTTEWNVPCVYIEDAPRFAYRGTMLDVGRHFMSKEFVKRYIDLLAFHKINTFHWHLTEDQGWRIEIKKYPRLTEIGASRDMTIEGHAKKTPRTWNTKRHSGFYTQEDIKEVVSYAQKRFITVIPEIEIPGHALAALAAYPELSCTGGPFEVKGVWGVMNDIYCTREEVFSFIQDVMDEVTALFPGEYIHIGGDEAPKVRWKRCNACQQRIQTENLKDEYQLQSYFVGRIAKHLNAKGKKVIGWDEIIEGGLIKEATVMSWRGEKGGIEAAKMGNEVIMTPNTHFYFDYYQGDKAKEPLAMGNIPVLLKKVYNYNPVPQALTPQEAKLIKGVQANLWTEYIANEQQVEYMTFPRLAALAEVAWTQPARKEYSQFLLRLTEILKHYDALGVTYRPLDTEDSN